MEPGTPIRLDDTTSPKSGNTQLSRNDGKRLTREASNRLINHPLLQPDSDSLMGVVEKSVEAEGRSPIGRRAATENFSAVMEVGAITPRQIWVVQSSPTSLPPPKPSVESPLVCKDKEVELYQWVSISIMNETEKWGRADWVGIWQNEHLHSANGPGSNE